MAFNHISTEDLEKLQSPRYRFFYYDEGGWHAFEEPLNRKLAEKFALGEPNVTYIWEGCSYMVMFSEFRQKNTSTAYTRSVGWRDEMTKTDFRPPTPFHGVDPALLPAMKAERMSRVADIIVPLSPDSADAVEVTKRFKAGLGSFADRFHVVEVQKVVNSNRRISHFRETASEVAAKRGGNANARMAWHGTTAKAVESIVVYGFGQSSKPKNGNAWGSGIYFAPENKTTVSLPYAVPDQEDLCRILMCQVILGQQEKLTYENSMLTPSSPAYDTGVDDLVDPRLYVVWSPFSNSHTLVEFVVVFKKL